MVTRLSPGDDNTIGWILGGVLIAIVVATFLVVVLSGDDKGNIKKAEVTVTQQTPKPVPSPKKKHKVCVQSHEEKTQHPEYTTFQPMWIGKTLIMQPMYHPSYETTKTICDKYEER